MKRSHSSDEEDAQPITDSKKSKNEPVFSNDNYYVIRKSKPTSVSLASLDSLMSKDKFKEADRRSTSSLTDKRDRFAPFDKKDRIHEKKDRSSFERPFDRSSSFGKSSFADSFKSQSTSSLIQPERSNISQGGYNIKIPTKFKLDIASQFGSDKQASKTSSSGYEIRSTSKNVQSNDSLKDQFYSLTKSKNLDYKLEYSVKLTVNGKSIKTTSCESAAKAEEQILLMAIKELQNVTADESMVEEDPVESELVQEIKQILRKQEKCLLFKDEVPYEYQKRFKRKIASNWFDKLSSDSGSFKIERHGSGNLVSIRLL